MLSKRPIIRNSNVFLGTAVAVILLGGGNAEARPEEEVPKKIQIYIGGNHFSSMGAYRSQRVKDLMMGQFEYIDEQEFDEYLSQALGDYPVDEIADLPKDELRRIIAEIKEKRNHYRESESSELELIQMKEILRDYMGQKSVTESIKIDPSKVRTITISPATK